VSNHTNVFEIRVICLHIFAATATTTHDVDDVYILGLSAVVNSKTEEKEAEKKKKRRKNE